VQGDERVREGVLHRRQKKAFTHAEKDLQQMRKTKSTSVVRCSLFSLLMLFCVANVACSSSQKKKEAATLAADDSIENEEEKDLEVSDPIEGFNRGIHAFNDFFFHYFLYPLATGWDFISPKFMRRGIENFFNWVYTPGRLVSNILQAKPKGVGQELASFSINATAGGLGFYDASKEIFEIERTNEDIDQTLGKWGIGEGAYVVLPFIGPRTVRGTFGFAGDLTLQPQTVIVPVYIAPENIWVQGAITAGTYTVRAVNRVSIDPGEYDNLIKDAVDPYIFIRDIYLQNTRKNVAD